MNKIGWVLIAGAMGCAITALVISRRLGEAETRHAKAIRDAVDQLDLRAAAIEQGAGGLQAQIDDLKGTLQATRRDAEALAKNLEELADHLGAKAQPAVPEGLAEVQTRLGLLEAYWAKQGTIIEPIPDALLTQGYDLAFKGDSYLGLVPVGNVLAVEGGGMRFAEGSHLSSSGPATALSKSLSDAEEFSVFIDFCAGNLEQGGPARIVSISQDGHNRNFTIAQQGTAVVVRLRTETSGANGTSPELTSDEGAITGKRQTLLYVREGQESILYVDGVHAKSIEVPGSLRVWDLLYPLMVANENKDDRQWAGDVFKVTFFNRPMTPDDLP